MIRLFMAILLAGMIFFMPPTYAEDKIYDGYGESHAGELENPDFAKMRAREDALQDAKDKAGVYVKAYSR